MIVLAKVSIVLCDNLSIYLYQKLSIQSYSLQPLNFEPARLLHIPAAFTVSTAGVTALGVGAAGYAGAHTILDGDGLHGRGLTQGDGTFVQGALSGGHGAIQRVVDFRASRAGHAHLSALLKLGGSAEVRGVHGRGHRTRTAVRTAIAGAAARITAASLS